MPINGDAFKPVASGDAVDPRINTAWFNAVTESADTYKRNRPRPPRGSGFTAKIPEGLILIRNDSGADRARFDILGIDDTLISSATNLSEFQNNTSLKGVVPTAANHTGLFVVCADAIPKSSIGRAFIFGVCPVFLDLQDPSDDAADVADGDATRLQSGSRGVAQIVWTETAEAGPQWAIIRFMGAGVPFPKPKERYQVFTPIDDTLVPIWTSLRFQ